MEKNFWIARISPLNAPIVDFKVWYAEISLSNGYGKLSILKRDWITAYEKENLAQSWNTEAWFTFGTLPETAGEVLVFRIHYLEPSPEKKFAPFQSKKKDSLSLF